MMNLIKIQYRETKFKNRNPTIFPGKSIGNIHVVFIAKLTKSIRHASQTATKKSDPALVNFPDEATTD